MQATDDVAFSSRSQRGFTLIELLVVIAIIGVLASLLLPALAKAKSQASRTSCVNSLRQVILSARLYSDEYDDRLPWPNWGTSAGWTGWLFLNAPAATDYDATGGLLWRYIRTTNTFRCPLDFKDQAQIASRAQKISSYCMNGSIAGYPGKTASHMTNPNAYNGNQRARVVQMKPDDIIMWEQDEKGAAGFWNDGANYPREGVSTRHVIGALAGLLDGQGEFIKKPAWDAMSGTDAATGDALGRTRTWNSPFTPGGQPEGH